MELQTHCHVLVQVRPTWKKLKKHGYSSEPIGATLIAQDKTTQTEATNTDHMNSKRKQTCNFWVHQNCIGLFCKTKAELKYIPFYCADHGAKN